MIGCNKTCILPKVSKVRNWGYDGSGANCGRVESIIPTDTVIDDKEFFEYDIPSPFNLDKENIEVTNEILYKKLADNAKIYRNIMCVFGIPVARKIHNAVYVIKNNKARLKYIIGKKK
jgi:hypothetical protein